MFKPLSQMLHEQHMGFGAVSMPAMPLPMIEDAGGLVVTVKDHSAQGGPPMDALAHYVKLASDWPEEERLQALVQQLTPLLMELKEVEVELGEQAIALLEERQKEVRLAGRAQAKKCMRKKNALGELELHLENAISQYEAAIGELRDLRIAERNGRHLSQWHTDGEKAAWDLRVKDAVKRVNDANAVAEKLRDGVNKGREELRGEELKLQTLARELKELEARIAGKPYVSPEFGLTS